MDRSTARIAFTALTIATIVVLGGCMDASLSQSGNAPASISIQDAPDAIPDVGVSITGGGVNISETVGPGTEALVFELPVGKEHEVEIDTTNFIGRKSFVLPPRGAQVDVQMLEKLFIPDQGGGRIARIDDMEGGNWRTSGSDNPYDLELGPDGRIYVANQSGGFDDVLAFDTIDDPTPDVIDADSFGVQAIGIDHSSRLVYYAGSNDGPYLLRRRIADPTSVDLDLTALISSLFSSYGIWGIAVDDSGAVYASGGAPDAAFAFGGSPRIVKIDPDSGSVLWTRTVNEANNFYGSGQTDVMHNGAGLFVASPRGTDGYKILKLDPATGNTLDHLGTYPDNPDAPDPEELRGPRRFIAVNNRKIHVIDDDGDDFNDARIVGFDNMGGEGWQSYGSYGSSEGQFFFYC